MSLLCKLFGHKMYTNYGVGNSYGRLENFYLDNIGRMHAFVVHDCERCGETWKVCNIHLPDLRTVIDQIIRSEQADLVDAKRKAESDEYFIGQASQSLDSDVKEIGEEKKPLPVVEEPATEVASAPVKARRTRKKKAE